MPSINMISPRRAEKRRLESNLRRLLVAIVVEVMVVLGVSGMMVLKISSTKADISGLNADIDKLRPTLSKIEYYNKEISTLKPKLDTLNLAKSDTLRWRRVLDDLSASLPQKTWLTRLAAQAPSDATKPEILVSLSGVSASQQLVGETMLRMQDKVSDFDKLDLNFTQKANAGSRDAVEFQVAAIVKLVAEKDKKEVEKS